MKSIPVLESPKILRFDDSTAIECVTVNGVPRIHVPYGRGAYSPALFAWAQQRESVQAELDRRGIRSLSELTEEREKTMRTVAWQDMQRYINGGE